MRDEALGPVARRAWLSRARRCCWRSSRSARRAAAGSRVGEAARLPRPAPPQLPGNGDGDARRAWSGASTARASQSERTASAEAHDRALGGAARGGRSAATRRRRARAARALIATGHMTNLIVTTTAGRTLVDARRPGARAAARDDPRRRGTADRDATSRACGPTAASSPRATASPRGWSRCAPASTASAARSSCRPGRCRRPGHARLARRRLPVRLAARPRLPGRRPDQDLPAERSRRPKQLCGAERRGHAGQHARADREPDLRGRARPAHARPDPPRAAQPAAAASRRQRATRAATRRPRSAAAPAHRAAARERRRQAARRPRRPVRARARSRAELRLHGRRIGSFVLSIQDDEGYLRLTRRLVGLRRADVHARARRPASPCQEQPRARRPATVPASGSYSYRGSRYRVFTVDAEAFPSGPLTIRVLIPIPYS